MRRSLPVLISILAAASLIACGSDTSLTNPTPISSPSPEAPSLRVIVKATGSQGGQVTVGVAAGSDFKISGTATQCFEAGEQVKCPVIPRWHQTQIGGFDANCAPAGSLYTQSVVWNCLEPSRGATFHVCAEDFAGVALGCDDWVMFVG